MPDAMLQLSRKEREKAEHRRLVLEAAEAVFAEKGYYSATVHEIAERAEFSVGYLYSLFAHKTDLYVELIDMRAAEFIADVEERLAGCEGLVDKVRVAVAAKVRFFERHQRFFRIFAHLGTGGRVEAPMALSEKPRRRYREYMRLLADIFGEGIKSGLFVDVDPLVMVHFMEGMTNAAIAHWVYSGGKEGGLAEPEVLERVFLRGILAERGE